MCAQDGNHALIIATFTVYSDFFTHKSRVGGDVNIYSCSDRGGRPPQTQMADQD